MFNCSIIILYTHSACADSVDKFSLQKSTPKISLVDLMRNAGSAVQSAESTAQRLLQFIAAQYSGVESEDIGNSSTVRPRDMQQLIVSDKAGYILVMYGYDGWPSSVDTY